MDHSYYRDKISAYSDGALEAQERELIRRHLEECAECRNLLERLNRLSAAIEENSGLSDDVYFENLAKKIEQRITSPEEKIVVVSKLRWNTLWWKVSAAAASLLLVGTIGYYQLKDDQEMPARILDELKSNRQSVSVYSDSVSVGQTNTTQGHRTAENDSAVINPSTESPPAKKDENQVPVIQREVTQIPTHEKPLEKSANQSPPPGIISKSPDSKAKPAQDIAVSKEKAETVSVEAEAPDIFAMSDSFSVSDINQKLPLSHWRSQRDSIQNVLGLQEDTVVASAKSQLKRFAAPSVSGLVKVDDSSSVYQKLANAWYQIALQTEDENEKNKAIQFLNWYKNKFPNDSSAVNTQLQQIAK